MVTFDEAADGMAVALLIYAGKREEANALIARQHARKAAVRRTLDWLRASCEADGLPEWCVWLVVSTAREQMRADSSWPLLPAVPASE